VFSKWYDDNANSNYKNNQLNTKHLKLPSEEDCAFMYKYASGYLKAKSYEHYEVSSYAKQKARGLGSWRSRHNQLYWEYSSSWFAVGMGATSFVQNQIVARPKRMDDYLVWVAEQKKLFDQTEGRKINDTPNDNDFLPDLLLKRLRTVDGLNLAWLEDHYGSETVAGVVKGAQLGLELGLVEQNEDTRILRLKDPQG
jgi:oxygen-independent coproporphyrinogen-3 oxidase